MKPINARWIIMIMWLNVVAFIPQLHLELDHHKAANWGTYIGHPYALGILFTPKICTFDHGAEEKNLVHQTRTMCHNSSLLWHFLFFGKNCNSTFFVYSLLNSICSLFFSWSVKPESQESILKDPFCDGNPDNIGFKVSMEGTVFYINITI